jgi:hypothetical protein
MAANSGIRPKNGHFGDFIIGYASSFDYLGGGRRSSYPELSGGFRREAEIVRAAWESVGNSIRGAAESYIGAHR